jgi:hypothetical protein
MPVTRDRNRNARVAFLYNVSTVSCDAQCYRML